MLNLNLGIRTSVFEAGENFSVISTLLPSILATGYQTISVQRGDFGRYASVRPMAGREVEVKVGGN